MMAERIFRICSGSFLATGLYFNETLWWLPWFMGIMFTFAGVTNICPMIMFLNKLGFE
jgi:hypothetical protein